MIIKIDHSLVDAVFDLLKVADPDHRSITRTISSSSKIPHPSLRFELFIRSSHFIYDLDDVIDEENEEEHSYEDVDVCKNN